MLKNKWFMFSLALFVIPFALNLVFYSQLPDVVPTHFDVNGQVDGTMPKFMGLFGMLFLCLAIHVFTCFVTVKDPKRNNIPDFMMTLDAKPYFNSKAVAMKIDSNMHPQNQAFNTVILSLRAGIGRK